MITTSTDDLNLAEVSELLADMQATHQELALEVDNLTTLPSPPPAIHWLNLLAGTVLGASAVAVAGLIFLH